VPEPEVAAVAEAAVVAVRVQRLPEAAELAPEAAPASYIRPR